jgi:hypothetical protein
MAVYKSFLLGETVRLQFRSEFFNAFNHPNFVGVSARLGAGDYGRVNRALEARIIEFGLRLEF